jgi:hypothetical protein
MPSGMGEGLLDRGCAITVTTKVDFFANLVFNRSLNVVD